MAERRRGGIRVLVDACQVEHRLPGARADGGLCVHECVHRPLTLPPQRTLWQRESKCIARFPRECARVRRLSRTEGDVSRLSPS